MILLSLIRNLFVKTKNIYFLYYIFFSLKEVIKILNLNNYYIAITLNQVGIYNRVFVIKILNNINFVFINWYLIWRSKDYLYSGEGCLSLSNLYIFKKRFKYIVLYCFNKGLFIKLYLMNFYSCCIQHEINHSLGKLIFS